MGDFTDLIRLGNKLSEETENRKHKFNEQWVGNLISFYRKNRGRRVIHLSDIDNEIFIKLNDSGRRLLHDSLESTEKTNNSLKLVKNYLKYKDAFISVSTLKLFFNKKNVDILEPYLKEIKTTKSGFGKSVKNPKFPINLNTDFGAILLGNYPDAGIRTGEFSSKDKESLVELDEYFNRFIGEIKSTMWRRSSYHMQISSIVKILYKLSGLETDGKQIFNNNAIPHWVFNSPKNFQSLLLRKLWDCEGSAPNFKKMCLGQSVILNRIHEDVPTYPKRKLFTKCEYREEIIRNPPNLLTSMQLLLYSFGIISYIKPHRLYKKKSGQIVCDWHLVISRHSNIKKFHDKIGFGLKRKQDRLKRCLDSYKRYPKERFIRENDILNIVADKETFTILDIKGKIELSEVTIRNYLIRLRKNQKIELIRTIPQPNTSSFFNEYRICAQYRNL